MPELSNDNLSLWLKARDGLPCEEARALIERLQEEEDAGEAVAEEYENHVSPEEHESAVEEAAAQGRREALATARDWILDRMDTPENHDKTVLRIAKLLDGMMDGYTPEAIKA